MSRQQSSPAGQAPFAPSRGKSAPSAGRPSSSSSGLRTSNGSNHPFSSHHQHGDSDNNYNNNNNEGSPGSRTSGNSALEERQQRKRAEIDLQLLANRIALLRAEEQRALTKVSPNPELLTLFAIASSNPILYPHP